MGNKISLLDAFGYGNFQIVMIGLDNAGKSTILYKLKLDQYVTTMPTIGFNCEKIKPTSGNAKGMLFTVWDVGGQERIRPLWRSYVRHSHAVLFVVDSDDEEKFEEAKIELSNLIRSNEIPSNAPVIMLANKQDLPGAKSVQEIEKRIGIHDICGNERPVITVPCCAVSGDGLDDCFDLIYDLIMKSRKMDKMTSKARSKAYASAVFR